MTAASQAALAASVDDVLREVEAVSDALLQPENDKVADDAEISRLAKLPLLEYGRQRKAAAERLKIDVTMLDRVVKAARNNNDEAGKQGRPVEFPDPEPWPTSVSGALLLNELITAIRSYVVMPDHAMDAVALWIIHTYLIGFFEITPRLAIT